MSAAYDITLEQGADFAETISLTERDRVTPAMDLTGCTLESKLFKNGQKVADFVCTVIDAPKALFSRTLGYEVIDNLEASKVPLYVHTLTVTTTEGEKRRLFKGRAFVSSEGTL